MLARPVTTCPRASGHGLDFRQACSSVYSGRFADDRGLHYLLEAPLPPEPEPDMDAIRAAHAAPLKPEPEPFRFAPGTAAGRFERSMVMDYEKWHDGIGYDIATMKAATPEERSAIESLLAGHAPGGRTPQSSSRLSRFASFHGGGSLCAAACSGHEPHC
jgi:hypothetical protein